ncbi:MAG: hypothetical protein WDM90_03030 [Ferruginibacter sp.]
MALMFTYGYYAKTYQFKQEQMDVANTKASKGAGIKRIAAKSNSAVYNNSKWDLVDAARDSMGTFDALDFKSLPDSLQKKSKEEIKAFVIQKSNETHGITKSNCSAKCTKEKILLMPKK